MKKILVFLSLNETFFPQFKPYFAGENRYCFVLRAGLEKNQIEALFPGEDNQYIPYPEKDYSARELKREIKEKYDECRILCRDSSQGDTRFENVISAAAARAKHIFLLDVNGGKRKAGKKKRYPAPLKRAGCSILNAVYRVYTRFVFGVVLIVAVVFFPFLWLRSYRHIRGSRQKPRICIAKRVHSNQSVIIARGLRELGYKAVTVNLAKHLHHYNRCDIDYVLSDRGRFYRFFILSAVFLYCLFKFDMFLFENNGESFFVSPLWEKWDIPAPFQVVELQLLRRLHKKILFEMRDCTIYNVPAALQARERNLCKNCSEIRIKNLCGNRDYVRSNRIALSLGHKILYSTVDLKPYLPGEATWLPNAIVTEEIMPQQTGGQANSQGIKNHQGIKIVHSASCEVMKGTQLVQSVVAALRETFEIELLILKGLDHRTALQKIKEADLALGQFNAGSYGNFEIESLACGKPVLGYINPELLPYYPPELPIVVIDGNDIERSLKENLAKLIANKELREETGRKSHRYALKVHDYKEVAGRLADIITEICA